MKVKDLIVELQTFSPDEDVVIQGAHDSSESDISSVRLVDEMRGGRVTGRDVVRCKWVAIAA